ncbi:type VI secretion system baseplate subunit TssE [Acetobacter nitrogenifigens]|uniref:type VI secretion system baseplate subunit TssE n=1 Tax=Acetobacter nitrogenifigens TaxID=285268 RepID=UPI0004012AD1|nr:type VI secretion system baseplate subunit TssE [Acetobacter nitrogenifigens]
MRSPRPKASRVTLSVLDRLMDEHPERETERPLGTGESLAALQRSVQRDLELLLNARRPWALPPKTGFSLAVSPMGYGMIDVTANVMSNQEEREAVRREIEATIRRFEPRLINVRVSLLPDNAPLSAVIPLMVEAYLLVDPEPEYVRYDTAISPSRENVTLTPQREV